MSYIGSTPTTQSFIAGTDYFNGTGAAVSFTMSRAVNSVNDIEVIVNNVEQIPSGYSVSGTTLTFSVAPSSGTSNVYVRYLSTTNLSLAIPSGTSATFNTVTVADGSATTPSITNDGDTNTGIFFPAADTIAFAEGGAEAMRIDSSGRLGIGTTTPDAKLTLASEGRGRFYRSDNTRYGDVYLDNNAFKIETSNDPIVLNAASGQGVRFQDVGTERMRLDSSGNLIVGKTAASIATVGIYNGADGLIQITRDGAEPLIVNRLTSDGTLVSFRQASSEEGTISVSGTTVSYNGGHLSRWAQTTTAKDDTLVKGTVLSNLDAMNVYTDADGNPVDNEQLNKVKVSDVEGDANVAGVFVNWTHDEDHNVDEINMAMTGDMIIRIAQGTTVARGDLLMSAGDGTAKPQGDDIVRSKTVAKVTSTHVTCTYADGSFCVPCVLMAC